MSLIIESGAVVANAESYASVTELRAYAARRGVTVPATDPACELLLIKAIDYLQAQEGRFKGERTRRDQVLAWPRYSVVANGYSVDSNSIPVDIKNAQMALAIEAQTVDLMPTRDAADQRGPVTEETVDVLTTKYGPPAVNRSVTSFAKANGLLDKFYKFGGGQIAVVRA